MSKQKKWSHGTVGSISHATMKNEDLMPKFCDELRWLGHRSKELTRIEKTIESANESYFESEESAFDVEILFDMLNSHTLPYMYFGSHPGDGSDYGFWISDTMEYEFDGLKVEDLSDVPSDYMGEILVINERGNMTLYVKSPRKMREIWSVV